VLAQIRSRAPDDQVELLLGTRARPEDVKLRVSGDAKLYKPDGKPLLVLCRAAISEDAAASAYPFLHGLRKHTTANRGMFAAEQRVAVVRKDGVVPKTTRTSPVPSAVVGYMDRYARIPYCRQCALSSADPVAWGTCFPLIREVARIFERELPDRYTAQAAAAKNTHPAYVISDTPFTTLTVNNTWAGGYHRDAGDYKPGFGVMCVLRRGTYRGGEIVLPAYGVGVDLQDRDVILFDVHEVHGNTPIVGEGAPQDPNGHERISVVFYFREKMVECLPPAEELGRAKRLHGDLSEDR
jgi:hypothetical protein